MTYPFLIDQIRIRFETMSIKEIASELNVPVEIVTHLVNDLKKQRKSKEDKK